MRETLQNMGVQQCRGNSQAHMFPSYPHTNVQDSIFRQTLVLAEPDYVQTIVITFKNI